MKIKTLHDKIGKSATSDLIKKSRRKMIVMHSGKLWRYSHLVILFLYQLYYQKYPSKEHLSSYLWSLKFLRNAVTHNNCLLNSLKAPYNITLHKNRDIQFQVSKIKSISEKSRDTWMQNPVIHDFVILVYVYLNIVKSEGIKQNGIRQLKWLFEEKYLATKNTLAKI